MGYSSSMTSAWTGLEKNSWSRTRRSSRDEVSRPCGQCDCRWWERTPSRISPGRAAPVSSLQSLPDIEAPNELGSAVCGSRSNPATDVVHAGCRDDILNNLFGQQLKTVLPISIVLGDRLECPCLLDPTSGLCSSALTVLKRDSMRRTLGREVDPCFTHHCQAAGASARQSSMDSLGSRRALIQPQSSSSPSLTALMTTKS